MSDVEVELETNDVEQSDVNRKGANTKGLIKKIRLNLQEEEHGPLNSLLNSLKDRGLKNYDLSDVVSEALATISEDWWKEKLEELTPLEWKVQEALDNPEMREKLMSLLDGK